ncbi:43kDa postsynaptic protein [Parasponia andersonii]|uniref:43kDa postsynaptic protein n=1 Tax=Parasponia andersonii TaxID=3476 RepID=A0A2P5BWE3_PARAD|nr:43kDa postsynaptic protein [Parasponia andersonii]
MDVATLGLNIEIQTDTLPLLMEQPGNSNGSEHIIDITGSGDGSSSSSSQIRPSNGLNPSQQEDRTSNTARVPTSVPPISSSNGSNSRNSSFVRRGDTRRHRSPLNSGLWISIELVLTIGQIVASIVVLSLSKHEHPRTPLFAWIVGYASGCVATLPLLYWRYRHNNLLSEQDLAQPRQTSQITVSAMPFSLSVRTPEGEDRRVGASSFRSRHSSEIMNARLKALVEYFKMGLDCFFAIWFVVGNVWIFGGHSSANEAPNLYREDLTHNRGATSESIDSLPTYKFKLKKNRNGNDRDGNSGVSEGGVIAAGTEKERVISGEDAVCCICLAKYANNDELKELPCSHFFHKECVDKWLKINASCPLCKNAVGDSPLLGSLSGENASHQNGDY